MMIATRILCLIDQPEVRISVRLFLPQRESIDWSCSFEIDWPDGMLRRSAVGIDACQALYLALQMIGTNLYMSDVHRSGQLMWLDPGQGYGFPVPRNIREEFIGEDNATM